ncbi:EF-hand domain-containing protein [Roseomonas sp. 18066]|uniref:EF-hand domain-containing protein n=1 Tax=Roseomonas sp. 18066 TaxID=2681412 RepID=UPI001357560A|nr:hypothetical protein [Roseomonas sp. 18066]
MLRRLPFLLLALLPACAMPDPAPPATTTAAPAAAAAPAAEAERPTMTPEQIQAARQRFRENFFAQYDTNRDGVVSRAEYDAIRAAQFERSDTNRDGKLSEAEYVAEYRTRLVAEYAGKPLDERFERQITQASRRFESIDRDRDLSISREEYLAVANRTFTRTDTNNDGSISAADHETARSHP